MKIVFFWLLLLGVLILLAGCEAQPGNIDKGGDKGEKLGQSGGNSLFRYYDREEGVVCYNHYHGLSCLRMVETR